MLEQTELNEHQKKLFFSNEIHRLGKFFFVAGCGPQQKKETRGKNAQNPSWRMDIIVFLVGCYHKFILRPLAMLTLFQILDPHQRNIKYVHSTMEFQCGSQW